MTTLDKTNNNEDLSLEEILRVSEFYTRCRFYASSWSYRYRTELCTEKFAYPIIEKNMKYSFELEQAQKKYKLSELIEKFPKNWKFDEDSHGNYIEWDKFEKEIENKFAWYFYFEALYKNDNTFVIYDDTNWKERVEDFVHKVKEVRKISDDEVNFSFGEDNEIKFKEQLCSKASLKENTKYHIEVFLKYTEEDGFYFSLRNFTEIVEAPKIVKNTEQIEKKSNPIFKIVLFILIFYFLWAFLDTL